MFIRVKNICVYLQNITRKIEYFLCFKKEEIEAIKDKVEHTKINASKYEKIEQRIPDFFALMNKMRDRNAYLENENKAIIEVVHDMYFAHITNNKNTMNECFKKFGFNVDNLSNNNKGYK